MCVIFPWLLGVFFLVVAAIVIYELFGDSIGESIERFMAERKQKPKPKDKDDIKNHLE